MKRLRPIILLLCLVVFLAACGKKGPVLPKLLPLPAAPAALTLEQRGERFLLAWDIPRTNQDGSPLAAQTFRILRMHFPPSEECAECTDDFTLVREVDLAYLQGVRRLGDRLFWWDDAPRPGFVYRYQVVATAAGRPGAPAQAQRPFLPPPPAPLGLQASGLDQLIRLRWEVPAADAGPLAYHLYRWQPGGELPLQPLTARPLTETAYEDFGLENGQTYLYAVSSVADIDGTRVESAPTAALAATPEAGK